MIDKTAAVTAIEFFTNALPLFIVSVWTGIPSHFEHDGVGVFVRQDIFDHVFAVLFEAFFVEDNGDGVVLAIDGGPIQVAGNLVGNRHGNLKSDSEALLDKGDNLLFLDIDLMLNVGRDGV